jgi:RND family efflux transporter MFP subunit
MNDKETHMTIEDPKTAVVEKQSEAQLPEKKRRVTPWVVAALLCLAVGILIHSGIHSRVQAEAVLARSTQDSATPTVAIVYPKSGSAAEEIALPGNTQAFTDTPVYARTSGYLKAWHVDIGSRVQKGQLLAEIETPELDQQLEQAQADLRSAQANLQLAQITAARWKHLLETDSVSKQETDQAISDQNSKQALVAASEANVRRLEQLVSFEHIYAPFDGVITARNTDIGALIQAGENSVPKELFHIAAINQLRVYIPVPEVYAGSAKTGEKVALTLDEYPDQTFTGTLVRNSNAIDSASRTLNVPPTAGAVTIPSNALLFRKEGLRVAVVSSGKAHLAPITIGHDYGARVEVIAGLSPRDAVIVDPSDSLEDGAMVQIAAATKGAAQ